MHAYQVSTAAHTALVKATASTTPEATARVATANRAHFPRQHAAAGVLATACQPGVTCVMAACARSLNLESSHEN